MKDKCSPPKPQASKGVHEKALEMILEKTGSNRRILDLPCGEGAMAFSLIQKGFNPVCGDIEPSLFKVSGLLCEKVDLDKGLPFSNHSFDDWVCIEGIEHIENPHHLIREARRIICPGGRLILSFPNTLSVKSRYYTLRYGYPVHFDLMMKKEQKIGDKLTVQHLNPISFIELRYILEEAGFTMGRIEANKVESRHPIRNAIINRIFVKKNYKKGDTSAETKLRHLLGSKTLLFGEILIIEAIRRL